MCITQPDSSSVVGILARTRPAFWLMAHSSGQYELFYGARRNPDGLARVDYRPLGKQRTQAVSAVRFSTVALIAVSLSASIGTRQDSLVCGICLPATRQRCILKIKRASRNNYQAFGCRSEDKKQNREKGIFFQDSLSLCIF